MAWYDASATPVPLLADAVAAALAAATKGSASCSLFKPSAAFSAKLLRALSTLPAISSTLGAKVSATGRHSATTPTP